MQRNDRWRVHARAVPPPTHTNLLRLLQAHYHLEQRALACAQHHTGAWCVWPRVPWMMVYGCNKAAPLSVRARPNSALRASSHHLPPPPQPPPSPAPLPPMMPTTEPGGTEKFKSSTSTCAAWAHGTWAHEWCAGATMDAGSPGVTGTEGRCPMPSGMAGRWDGAGKEGRWPWGAPSGSAHAHWRCTLPSQCAPVGTVVVQVQSLQRQNGDPLGGTSTNTAVRAHPVVEGLGDAGGFQHLGPKAGAHRDGDGVDLQSKHARTSTRGGGAACACASQTQGHTTLQDIPRALATHESGRQFRMHYKTYHTLDHIAHTCEALTYCVADCTRSSYTRSRALPFFCCPCVRQK